VTDIAAAFEAHRSFLWGLAYRLTGSAADADDVVQTTFLKAVERPPRDTSAPWRPWLVRVAVNAGRDLLRRRRRRPYDGPWLPSPIETPEGEPPSFEPVAPDATPLARYELMESLSMAFLVALEALTPNQRAVLLLRDAFDYSVRETARALEMSEDNVKSPHRRARLRMAGYDARHGSDPTAGTGPVLERFLRALAIGDVATVESLLAADVVHMSDAAGEFSSARETVRGRERVARLYLGLAEKGRGRTGMALRLLNGEPAALVDVASPAERTAPRFTLHAELDRQGRICGLFTVLATAKLARVSPELAQGVQNPDVGETGLSGFQPGGVQKS